MKKNLLALSVIITGFGIQVSGQGVWTGTTVPTTTTAKTGIGTTTPEAKLTIKETQSQFTDGTFTGKSLLIENTSGIGGAEFNVMEVHNRPLTLPESNFSLIYWLSNKGNLGLKSLATGGANKMVTSNSLGILGTTPMPTLSLSGSTLSISGGNSVTLPSGSSGDNLGNHIATNNLTMSNKDIGQIHSLYFNYGGAIEGNGGMTITAGNGQVVINSQVSVLGSVTANNFFTSSDLRLKENITTISSESKPLLGLAPITYSFKKNIEGFNFDNKKHFGLSAQEVQKVYPDLVEEQNGYLKVNYIEMIPLLLQEIKEQNNRIEALEEIIQNISSTKSQKGIEGISQKLEISSLSQNVPNPFDKETIIRFNIKQSFNNAFIGVYDLSGKQIKKIPISQSQSEITIPANSFVAGTYIYSLVVDGKIIDSKRMISI